MDIHNIELKRQLSYMWDLLHAALNIRGDGVTISTIKGSNGMMLQAPPKMEYLVSITDNYGNGSYAWARVYPDDFTGEFADAENVGPHGFNYLGYNIAPAAYAPMQGDDVNGWLAYERSGKLYVPIGAQVWIYPHYQTGTATDEEWVFDYTPEWVDSDIPWIIETTLDGSITDAADTAVLTDAGKFPSQNKYVILIDEEEILVGAGYGSNSISSLIRGWNSTIPAAHSSGATVALIYVNSLPDLSKLTASMVFEVYPGDDTDTALILNPIQPISVESGPDANGFFSGNRLQYDPVAEVIDTEEQIYCIDLNNF